MDGEIRELAGVESRGNENVVTRCDIVQREEGWKRRDQTVTRRRWGGGGGDGGCGGGGGSA